LIFITDELIHDSTSIASNRDGKFTLPRPVPTVMILSLIYVNYLANKLEATERTSVELFSKAQVALAKTGNRYQ
jgi:hypothetical protein